MYKTKTKDNITLERIITPGCISDSDRLNKSLRLLKERGWVDREGKPKYYTYFLNEKYYTDPIIESLILELKQWKPDNLMVDFVYDMKMKECGLSNEPILDRKDAPWVICGISYEMFEVLTFEQKKQLNILIQRVRDDLEKITRFKLSLFGIKTIEDMLERVHEFKKEGYDPKQIFNLGFYYRCTPMMTPEKYVKMKNKEPMEKK